MNPHSSPLRSKHGHGRCPFLMHVHNQNHTLRGDYRANPRAGRRRPDNAFIIGQCPVPQFTFRFIADFIGCPHPGANGGQPSSSFPPLKSSLNIHPTFSLSHWKILLQEWNPVKFRSKKSRVSRSFVYSFHWGHPEECHWLKFYRLTSTTSDSGSLGEWDGYNSVVGFFASKK